MPAPIPPIPTYALYQGNLPPGWLTQPYGGAWANAQGITKDALLEQMKEGMLARYPLSAPLDGIGVIGQDRGMQQGITETLASYQERLQNVWGEWSVSGMAWGLLSQLGQAGYSDAYVVYANGYVYGPASGVVAPDPVNDLPGTPPVFARAGPYYGTGGAPAGVQPPSGLYPGWSIGSGNGQGDPGFPSAPSGVYVPPFNVVGGRWNPAFWNAFVVVLSPPPTAWTDIVNPPTVITSPSIAEIQYLSALINKWKAGHALCGGILVVPSGSGPNPTVGWPVSTWLARAGVTKSIGPNASVYRWAPHETIVVPGGANAVVIPSGGIPGNRPAKWYYSATGGTTGYLEPTWPGSGTVTESAGTPITWHYGGVVNTFLSASVTTVFALIEGLR